MLFYEPTKRDRSVLPHDPFKALIAPRPIGWVSTMGHNGDVNLAPYSFFNAIADRPPMLAFSSIGVKDSVTFAQETREFVWNMPTYALREAMNATSGTFPRGENEFLVAGLDMAPGVLVKVPRVAASPCAMECKVTDVMRLKTKEGGDADNWLVIGEVVGVHLDPGFIKDGVVQITEIAPIARCGYLADYAVLDELFQMTRPR